MSLKEVLQDFRSLPTGEEFLGHPKASQELYAAYLDYWNTRVMPELVHAIKVRGTVEDAHILDHHS